MRDSESDTATSGVPVGRASDGAPTDVRSDAPTEVPAHLPADAPADLPADAPAEVPADLPADRDLDGARADGRSVFSEAEFRPGDDAVPAHTMEFVRIDGKDALQRYVPGDYIPRGALPAEDLADGIMPGSRASARNSRRRPTPTHALLGILFWAITVALFITGLTLGLNGDYATSRVIAFIAIGASVAGFLLGAIATILGRGRELGIVAMVLCVVSNPLVLAELLGWVSTLTS